MKTKTLPLAALFLALYLVFDAISLQPIPILRLTFAFVPIALAGWLLGAFPAMCIAAAGDILAFFWHNRGAYLPGLTLSAILIGLTFGLLLHKKKVSIWRVAVAQGIVTVFIHLIMDSYWLAGLYGDSALVAFSSRYISKLLLWPILTILIFGIQKALEKVAKNQ